MALGYQGVTLGEREVCDLLETPLAGTEVLNTLLLEQRVAGCQLALDSASFEKLQETLAADILPIVFVVTRHLSCWQRGDTIHALVVGGVTDDGIHVNDPVFADAPRVVSRREFSLAWSELDHLAAILTVKRDP
jgi:hypothetical protein